MAKKVLTDLDLNQNELQNTVIQNLASAPATPKAGQTYYNSTNNNFMGYNGTSWIALDAQGQVYTFSTGLTESSGTVTLNQATGSALGGVIVGSNISVSNGTISVANASTSTKGVIEIATDTEASTGTSETLAVNPKQLATKVTSNTAITGATKCKITYDSKGLVTAGADLSASDIPDISATYQTKLSSTNKLSTDYISGLSTVATTGSYSDLTGTPTVDQTYSGTSTNAQSGVAVKSAIDAAISSVYKPAGSVAFANLPSPSSSIEGYVYDVTDAFTTTADFVEGAGKNYPAGTNVVCINTTGTTYKWDVLTGMVDLSAYQLASTAVTHTASTAVGSATHPVYIASDGTATETTYSLAKSVPADAVFTDTTYSVFTGATGSAAGTSGLVKAPAAGDNTKFLKGDCTWAEALQNTATGSNALTILGTASTYDNATNIGKSTTASVGGTALGMGAAAGYGATAIGMSSAASATAGIALGYNAKATANYAYQIGNGTNNEANSLYVSTSNSDNWKLLGSDGYIPNARLNLDTAPTSASGNAITSGAVYTAITGMATKSKFTNGALTSSSGICTWTITTAKAPDCICRIRETTGGAEVECDVTYGNGSITIKINSTSNISAGTYTAVVIG